MDKLQSVITDMNRRVTKKEMARSFLFEVAWEVCNQLGGIYTVIRSKVPTIVKKWGENYCLIGPYINENVSAVFDPIDEEEWKNSAIGKAALKMKEMGIGVHYGHWLVTGRPKVILLDPNQSMDKLNDIKRDLWEHHQIPTGNDPLVNQVLVFGLLVKIFFSILTDRKIMKKRVVGHFHEWMGGVAIPEIRYADLRMTTVFTTHATLLGRYLAMNSSDFYKHLQYYDWEKEAKHFNIEAQVHLERAAAHGCHVFTTVSDVTGRECIYLLGRRVDMILPNGINIDRYEVLHELQNLHAQSKKVIDRFTAAHFFQTYNFELDDTLYFFTSGRYEYKNKGYDFVLEALARLNWRMKQEGINKTVVMFFITRKPSYSINPEVFHSRALLAELRQTCDSVMEKVGEKLFYEAITSKDGKLPSLDDLVDDYWRLRFRRTFASWKTENLPSVVTHNIVDDSNDEILQFLRRASLYNKPDDKVKVVYHPDFISPTSPLFGMEYGHFVRGCHLGIFPSYYEPWGYTPLECMASGIPAVTSDLAGFGDFALGKVKDPNAHGVYIVNRANKNFDAAVDRLVSDLMKFVKQSRRERIKQRNRCENTSQMFSWDNLTKYYDKAYSLALHRY